VTLSRQDMINIYSHTWREPIIRALADGPKRWAELCSTLREIEGDAPGDGYINTELRSLQELGLLERRQVKGTHRRVYALTPAGEKVYAAVSKAVGNDDSDAGGSTDADRTLDEARQDSAKGLSMDELEARALLIDTTTPHPARRYNYLLGGKDNFAVDRESGDQIERVFPGVRISVLEGRRYLQRVVKFLAGEAGIDQFLDIGTGLPTADNTHEVAQRINPSSRVVYVDNDPMVMTHSRALLTSTPEGRSYYLEEDLRNPDRIINHPDVQAVIDFDKPVALMLVAVLHFIRDDAEAYSVVSYLKEQLPQGSYVAISHLSVDTFPPDMAAFHHRQAEEGKTDAFARTRQQFFHFFDDLKLVEPGIVVASDWRSTVPLDERPRHQDVAGYGAVGFKDR